MSDSHDWWDHAMSLAKLHVQKSIEDGSTSQIPILQKFARFDRIATLELNKGNATSSNFFNTIPQDSLVHLRHLLIKEIPFSSKDLASLMNAAPNLETIDMKGGKEPISFKHFYSDLSSKFNVVERHVSLLRLNLIQVSITPEDLATFLIFCPRIKEIDLRGISLKPNDLRNSNFAKLPYESRANLEELYLFKENILSVDVSHMLANFPNLKRVGLSGCPYISNNHVRLFRHYYPKVLFL